MAAIKMLLLPVTLCFLLLVLAAESKEDNDTLVVVVVVFYGTARCKFNTSRIISST
jgi:hypothetical protein